MKACLPCCSGGDHRPQPAGTTQLTPHLCLLIESGGALVSDHPAARDPVRQLLKRRRADCQDREVRDGLRQVQDAVKVDRNRGLNPGEDPAALLVDFRDGRLVNNKKDCCHGYSYGIATQPVIRQNRNKLASRRADRRARSAHAHAGESYHKSFCS